ncbi:uncharacterized protein [Epargyreus clarus]|uniref:uncharacterized protein n=1 Tax=Epargyreus clarus TaxID=520877 RepID=UPI003C2F14C3
MEEGLRPSEWIGGSDYRMYGAPVLLLRLSRVFCTAPVALNRQRFSYIARVSRRRVFCSRFLLFLTGLVCCGVLLFDIYSAAFTSEKNVRIHSAASIALWAFKIFFLCLIIILSLKSSERIQRVMFYLTRAQKILINMENKPIPKKLERLLRIKVSVCVASMVMVCVMKYVENLKHVFALRKHWIVHCAYTFTNIHYVFTCFLELQISFVITSLLWCFKSLNKRLKKYHSLIEQNGSANGERSAMAETIRDFSRMYASLVDLAKEVNDTEGGTMVLLLCYYVFQIIVNLYLLLGIDYNPVLIWRIIMITTCVYSCVYITFVFIVLIEPCHKTHEELKKTQVLVSQVLCCPVSARDPVSVALTQIYEDQEINEPIYVPRGVCELSRTLFSAVIGIVVTYVVTSLQFGLRD